MDWNLFQTLYAGIITPVLAAGQAMIGPMSNAMQPVATGVLSLWALFAIWDLCSHTKTLQQVGRSAFSAMMFYSLVWTAAYNQYISTFFMTTLPNSLSAALGGSTVATPVGRLDALLGQAVSQASAVYEALPGYSLKGAILSVGVILFVIMAMVCLAFIFIVMCTAGLITVLALVVGPAFLSAAVKPITRRFASGWLAVLVGGVVTQIIAVAAIQLLIGATTGMLKQLATTAQASNSNSIMMLYGLAKVGVLLWLFMTVIKKVPDLAQIIGGGVYHGTNAAFTAFTAGSLMTSVALGAATGGAGGAVAGARATGTASGAVLAGVSGAASGAGRSAARGFRYAAPAGRSLSRGRI